MPRPTDPVTERVRGTADGLNALLAEAASARAARAEVTRADAGGAEAGGAEVGGADADTLAARAGTGPDGTDSGTSAVCAWNHFENIPTFYNWNNRPR